MSVNFVLHFYLPRTKYDGRLYFQFVSSHPEGGGGVTASPSHNTCNGPMSFPGSIPVNSQVRMGYSPPPQPRLGYPPGQDSIGYPPGTGYSWTGYATGGMPLVVFPQDFLVAEMISFVWSTQVSQYVIMTACKAVSFIKFCG